MLGETRQTITVPLFKLGLNNNTRNNTLSLAKPPKNPSSKKKTHKTQTSDDRNRKANRWGHGMLSRRQQNNNRKKKYIQIAPRVGNLRSFNSFEKNRPVARHFS